MSADLNVSKQIEYWKNGSVEDLEVARELLASNRFRHGLFFLHLALEKVLKAHVCRVIQDVPPRIHNLVRLAGLAQLPLTTAQKYFLEEMNNHNLEGRYPDQLTPELDWEHIRQITAQAEDFYRWLTQQL